MNENQAKQKNLIDTTDCLEAIGVFRGWKNFLFVIAVCCLLLLQISFWLVDRGWVETDDAKSGLSTAVVDDAVKIEEAAKKAVDPNQPIKATPQEPNQPTEASQEPQQQAGTVFRTKFENLAWLIRFLNFVLILVATLYCLTMLFSLKVSLLGRLGGINHISRAFFLSLAFLVLLLPWQRFFAGVVAGAMYTPEELLNSYTIAETKGIFGTTLYYLRFTGYWLLVLLLLIFSQRRSIRWARAILHRLEVI